MIAGQPVPLHRLPEHREVGAAGGGHRWAARMTTKLFGTGSSGSRTSGSCAARAGTSTTSPSARTTLHAAVLRSPHAHARVLDVHVDDVLDLEGVHAVWTYEDLADLPPPMADPLPLLIPHPTLTHGRTQYALANGEVNYVGEAIAFVVADDRYVAEDAVGRIRVDYEVLPPVVGIEAARAAAQPRPRRRARQRRRPDGAEQRRRARGHRRRAAHAHPRPDRRAQLLPADGGPRRRRPLGPRRQPADRCGRRRRPPPACGPPIAVKLGLDLGQVDVVTPDVGGGFGVKINHPWPEELLVPLAARALGRPVKFIEDRREHFISSAHERGQVHHVEVGFDDDGRLLGLDVQFWHDHGAYTPYGLIVPIITSTQLLGPYKPGAYRVSFESLYTNTVIVTPYRGAGRPQGCFVMERTMDAIAECLGKDRAEVRADELHPARRVPLRPGADLPGRPRARVRLRRLPGVAGEDQGAGRLGRVPCLQGRDGRAGPAGRHRPGLLRRGHRRRALRRRPRPHRDHRARSRSPPASPRRGRATPRSSRRSRPTCSAYRSRTSRWSPATPAGCRTPWARSPREPR